MKKFLKLENFIKKELYLIKPKIRKFYFIKKNKNANRNLLVRK